MKGIERTEDLPELRKLKKHYVDENRIIRCLRGNPAEQKLTVYYLRKYTDKTLQEIIEKVYKTKKSSASVSKAVSRIESKRMKDKQFNKELAEIERFLSMSRSDP